jgi:hypothetical protein
MELTTLLRLSEGVIQCRGHRLVFRRLHVVAIARVLSDGLLILDPVNDQSVVQPGAFPGSYFGGATLNDFIFTRKAS